MDTIIIGSTVGTHDAIADDSSFETNHAQNGNGFQAEEDRDV